MGGQQGSGYQDQSQQMGNQDPNMQGNQDANMDQNQQDPNDPNQGQNQNW